MMQRLQTTFGTLLKCFAYGAFAALLVACDGDNEHAAIDNGTGSTAIAGGRSEAMETFSVAGSVGDGPVINADMFFFTAKDELITGYKSNAFANYALDIKVKNSAFPITIKAVRGIDLVTGMRLDFTLQAVAPSAGHRQVNLNPYTT
ncbi:MAG: hypothetical protein ABR553_10725, partial [Gammaproteobacteria bacterium]